MEFELRGEHLRLLPERAIFWPRRRTLMIADPHFGKADTFRHAAIPVPDGSTVGTLQRLDIALDQTGAERLVILGDFWHARVGRSPQVLDEISNWRSRRASLGIELVLGNHDRPSGAPPDEWNFVVHPDDAVDPPFVWSHFPEPKHRGYVLAGHLHPSIRLQGRGRQRLRLPCFWFGDRVGVLPAFGEFTGAADIEPGPGERVFVIAAREVVPFPSAH